MRKIVILGSGAGGTMVAANLRKELAEDEWAITVIDKEEQHHFQSGYLFIPFGVYSREDVLKPKRDFIAKGIEFVVDKVVKIDTDQRRVETQKGDKYGYDWLVIATGCRIVPEEVEGMMDAGAKTSSTSTLSKGRWRCAKSSNTSIPARSCSISRNSPISVLSLP